MQKPMRDQILTEWSDEFSLSLSKSNALCVALFSVDRELIFATPVMLSLFKGEPSRSFINPTFDELLKKKQKSSQIFKGFLTIGNNTSINSSIIADVFRKDGKLLVIGGADTAQLIEQYKAMHLLNHDITNLQRQLLKEKNTLEKALIQLNKANTALKQLNATKDKFFSIIAHDLRSPFNGFLGLTKIMSENLSKFSMDQLQNIASRMNKSATNLFSLLNNLLEWSQIQQGTVPFKPTSTQLSTLFDENIALAGESAKMKHIKITSNVPDTLEVAVDINMFKSIIRNLLSNAIKFTSKGGTVNLSAKSTKDNNIEISIKDTGIGMSEDLIDNLFKIDVDTGRDGTEGELSTGLGLLLCKELIEKHEGKIWVESTVGVGTTFYLSIPVKSENLQRINKPNIKK